MGEETTVALGETKYSPQEISAIILRTLKQRAEKELGHPVSKAVITVPAFFDDGQRVATRQAGELAGLEVVRIINEPTAAVLTYDPHPPEMERLLVYDLGGGTFDVSIAQVEQGVVEILASHGDTHLGGDDFDQRLLDFVCDRFRSKHGVDPRESIVPRSRLLRAVEDAKKQLSVDAVVTIAEEFIAEKKGVPLNLNMEVTRTEYEALIEPLLAKTLVCLDRALEDAKLPANQVHKVLLVGGATRTPRVHEILAERLGRPVHSEIEPDLAVAMGAAVQGGLIAGVDVGPVLVDITPHSLGVETLGLSQAGYMSHHHFSPILARNSTLPANRTEIYSTVVDGQEKAQIRVFQGEEEDTRFNALVGEFIIEDLADLPSGNQILVRLDLDLSGILKVTATERVSGKAKHVVIDNAMERFRKRLRTDAADRLDEMFGSAEPPLAIGNGAPVTQGAEARPAPEVETLSPSLQRAIETATALAAKADRVLPRANAEDAAELRVMLADLRSAVDERSEEGLRKITGEVEDLVFYLEDQ
jgi:molecular chaperone DnaK